MEDPNKEKQRDAIHEAFEKFLEIVKETHQIENGMILYWMNEKDTEESVFGFLGNKNAVECLGVAQHFVHYFANDF